MVCGDLAPLRPAGSSLPAVSPRSFPGNPGGIDHSQSEAAVVNKFWSIASILNGVMSIVFLGYLVNLRMLMSLCFACAGHRDCQTMASASDDEER